MIDIAMKSPIEMQTIPETVKNSSIDVNLSKGGDTFSIGLTKEKKAEKVPIELAEEEVQMAIAANYIPFVEVPNIDISYLGDQNDVGELLRDISQQALEGKTTMEALQHNNLRNEFPTQKIAEGSIEQLTEKLTPMQNENIEINVEIVDLLAESQRDSMNEMDSEKITQDVLTGTKVEFEEATPGIAKEPKAEFEGSAPEIAKEPKAEFEGSAPKLANEPEVEFKEANPEIAKEPKAEFEGSAPELANEPKVEFKEATSELAKEPKAEFEGSAPKLANESEVEFKEANPEIAKEPKAEFEGSALEIAKEPKAEFEGSAPELANEPKVEPEEIAQGIVRDNQVGKEESPQHFLNGNQEEVGEIIRGISKNKHVEPKEISQAKLKNKSGNHAVFGIERPVMNEFSKEPVTMVKTDLSNLANKLQQKIDYLEKFVVKADKVHIQLDPDSLGKIDVVMQKVGDKLIMEVDIYEQVAREKVEQIFEDLQARLQVKEMEIQLNYTERESKEEEKQQGKQQNQQETNDNEKSHIFADMFGGVVDA